MGGEKNGGRVIAEPPRRTLGVSRGLGQSPSGGKGQSPSETQSLTYFKEDCNGKIDEDCVKKKKGGLGEGRMGER